MEFPIVGPAYTNPSLPANAQELVNMYLRPGGPGGKDYITRTPGLTLFTSVGNSRIDLLFVHRGELHAISNNTLFSIDSVGTVTSLGSVGSGTYRVDKLYNTSYAEVTCIVTGTKAYTLDTVLTQITDVDLISGPIDVATLSNVMVVINDVNRLFNSAAGVPTTWEGDQFSTSVDTGTNVAILEDHDELFLFGTEGIQIFDYAPAGTEPPFVRRSGGKIEVGAVNKESIAQLDNSFMFLGSTVGGNARIWRIQGYQPLNVTSPAMEAEISTYSTLSDARAFSYYDQGSEFYVITFPTAGKTWVYDASVGDPQIAWHRRESYLLGRWRANAHAYCNSTHYIGDYASGKIYTMSPDVYDEAGSPLIAKRTAPHYPPGFYSYLKLGIESGVGLVTGQGSDPQVILRWSDDDGRTFPGYKTRSMGARGDFDELIEFHSLGMTRRQRVFEVSCSDPVPFTIYSADLGFRQYGK